MIDEQETESTNEYKYKAKSGKRYDYVKSHWSRNTHNMALRLQEHILETTDLNTPITHIVGVLLKMELIRLGADPGTAVFGNLDRLVQKKARKTRGK